MKALAKKYIFDASAKTVTFTGDVVFTLDQILLITNVTDNLIIYNFADPACGGSITNNILTLDYDTTGMSDMDVLQVFVDVPNYQDAESSTDAMLVVLQEILHEMHSMKKAQGIPDVAGRIRVMPEGGSVTRLYQMGNNSFYLDPMFMSLTNLAAKGLRSNIACY